MEPFGRGETFCGWLRARHVVSVHYALEILFLDLQATEWKDAAPSATYVSPQGLRVCLREVSAEDAQALRYVDDFDSAETTCRRFGIGSRLFAAVAPEGIVSLNWVNPHRAFLSHVKRPEVRLPQGVVYVHGGLTAPAYRNAGIGTALRQHFLNQMRREGVRLALSIVYVENTGAMRWHLSNGFQRWGRITYLRRHGRQMGWTRLTAVGQRHPDLLEGVRRGLSISSGGG